VTQGHSFADTDLVVGVHYRVEAIGSEQRMPKQTRCISFKRKRGFLLKEKPARVLRGYELKEEIFCHG